jgi:hypothetical protein
MVLTRHEFHDPMIIALLAKFRSGGILNAKWRIYLEILALIGRSALTRQTVASGLRIALAVVLAIVALRVTVKRLDQFASRYNNYDFDQLFDWGTRYRTGQDIWAPHQEGETRPGKPRQIYNQPPAFVEAFAPLTRLDQPTAHWIWEIAQVAFLTLAVWLVASEIDPPPDPATVVIFIALALLFQSVRRVLFNGQQSPLLLLSMVIAWKSARRDRPAAAGLSLAIGTLLKLYPGALAVYFLLRKRWSVLSWTAAFFLAGVVATGVDKWLKMPGSHDYDRWLVVHNSKNSVALLPNIYAWSASLAKGGAPPWIAVIAVTVILDIGLAAVLFWATSDAANDSVSDGLVFGLWLIAMVLISPLAFWSELVMLFPAYIFASIAAWRLSISGRAFPGLEVVAGAILIGICAAVELVTALPDFQPHMLEALLIFIATTTILTGWLDASRRSGYRTTQSVELGAPAA